MHKFCIAICCSLAFSSLAQDLTNAPKTKIENFETQTGVIIVKGFGQIGSVTTSAGIISVRCKESADAMSGRKEYGVAVEFALGQQRERLIIDYDEIDSLVKGIDYLAKITYDVTTLPGFEATYATKSGLRVMAHSDRKQGGIRDYLQFPDNPGISLASEQLVQFQNLIGQAKKSLDALMAK